MKEVYVFSKVGNASLATSVTVDLQPGETITNVVLGYTTPVDNSNFAVASSSQTANPILLTLTGGTENMTYGTPLTVTTNQRVMLTTLAVTCTSSLYDPYKNEDPSSFQDLVGQLVVGKSAVGLSVFQFAPDFDPLGGYVLWDVLDSNGVVYASGNAFDYKVSATGVANIVRARCIISVPSNMEPSLDNDYQLRYTLRVGNGVAYNYENIQIIGLVDTQIGTTDSVELQGDKATLSLVTQELYKNYALEIYRSNKLAGSMALGSPDRVASGYFSAGTFDTSGLPVSLVPYDVVWKFWNYEGQVFRETSAMWIINPSIARAIDDVKSKVNKARHTLFGTPDSQYTSLEVLKWLRRGMDMFNAAYGVLTGFTMTNALGGVREFWLMCAEKAALEAQYGLEVEKSFNFSGAAISLDVDRTGQLESMISRIQGILDSELKPFKQNLIIKGATGGDGSGNNGDGDFSTVGRSSLGAVGITITPASIYNGLMPGMRWLY